MDTNLTVTEAFRNAKLSPSKPVRWETLETCISDLPQSKGVYVVARVGDPNLGCEVCDLPFRYPLPPNLVLDFEYERQRWLSNEPVLYIGGTTRTVRERVREFYVHKVGEKRPHKGGEVVKLLACDEWVYWSPADDPEDSELVMICAFRNKVGQLPFANKLHAKPKRIRCSS